MQLLRLHLGGCQAHPAHCGMLILQGDTAGLSEHHKPLSPQLAAVAAPVKAQPVDGAGSLFGAGLVSVACNRQQHPQCLARSCDERTPQACSRSSSTRQQDLRDMLSPTSDAAPLSPLPPASMHTAGECLTCKRQKMSPAMHKQRRPCALDGLLHACLQGFDQGDAEPAVAHPRHAGAYPEHHTQTGCSHCSWCSPIK